MLNRRFINELFEKSQLISQATTKTLIEKIVHTSIMRLNQDSMDKLYDLMTMAIKYQFFTCPEPSDMFEITKIHIDNWVYLTTDPEILLQIQHAQALFVTVRDFIKRC